VRPSCEPCNCMWARSAATVVGSAEAPLGDINGAPVTAVIGPPVDLRVDYARLTASSTVSL
jgi:hypothetical protein